MAGHTQIAATAHERFMQQVQKELEAFERHERELWKQTHEEETAQLQMLLESSERKKTLTSH